MRFGGCARPRASGTWYPHPHPEYSPHRPAATTLVSLSLCAAHRSPPSALHSAPSHSEKRVEDRLEKKGRGRPAPHSVVQCRPASCFPATALSLGGISVSWRDLCLLSGFRPELASVVTLAKSARPLRRWSNPAADWTGYYCCCCFRAAADMPSVGDQLLSSIMSSASRLLLVPGPSVIKKLDLDPSPPDIMEL